ncbi:MAG: transposase [Planctomycetes bacterium]|nr:transposase [Planctomycetota bacterium]
MQDNIGEFLKHYPHAPSHMFASNTVYMVTAGTMYKQRIIDSNRKLMIVQTKMFEILDEEGWLLQAWAVLSNHYHLVACSGSSQTSVSRLVGRLHSVSSRALNLEDATPGRKVWFQFWDTCLTHEKSYYPRIGYVNNNAVHHGIVKRAEDYPFCSAGWFERNAEQEFKMKVKSFKFDKIKVEDEF